MTTNIDLIISIILFIIIAIYKIFEHKHNRASTSLSKKNKLTSIILFIISLVLFVIVLIINITVDDNNTSKTLEYIINALSIAIIALPITFTDLYSLPQKNSEELIYTKTIVTNIIDKKIMNKFKIAGMNTIILTEENTDLKLPSFKEEETKKYCKQLNKNIIIKTDNLKLLNKLLSKETTCFEFKDLESLYHEIKNNRGKYDNYLRTIKYLINTYLPILISYFILCILKFPPIYSLILIIILKMFTIIVSRLLYKNIQFDVDIMERKPIERGATFNKQDIMFMLIQSFFNTFTLCVPYMLVLAYGGTKEFANTLFFIVFIYENIFMTISYLSEENILKNILKIFKSKKIILYIIMCISFTIFINFNSYFNTRNIELHNYLSCILFGFIPILFNEYTKFARYMTKKGKKKNERKNNK